MDDVAMSRCLFFHEQVLSWGEGSTGGAARLPEKPHRIFNPWYLEKYLKSIRNSIPVIPRNIFCFSFILHLGYIFKLIRISATFITCRLEEGTEA
jgi:hypothetical protein